jgi:hypothetical protein
MSNNIQNDIQAVNQTFDDMLAKFKTNYVNFHTNATLSLPSSPPPSSTDSLTPPVPPTPPASNTNASSKDPNDAELLKYRYAANQLLEKVRSQIASNSKKIAGINTDISPVQKAYLNIMETGTSLDQTKSAAVVSLEDYNELYRTTVFGTMMYAVGAGLILYLLYKPRIQSEF